MLNSSASINQTNVFAAPRKDPFAEFKTSHPAKITTHPDSDEFVESSRKNKKDKTTKVLIGLGAVAVAAVFTSIIALRRLEAKFFRNQFDMEEIIPAMKDRAKSLILKTNNGINVDAWDINPQDSKKYIVFCNGIANHKQQGWLQETYLKLADSEYGVIAFDYLGRGKSGGKFSQKGTYQSIEAVFDYLKSKGVKQEDIGLVGHSLGCGAAANFAKKNEHAFVVMINPFNKLKDLIKSYAQKLDAPKPVKSALEKIPSWMIPVKNTFNNEKALKNVKSPVLIISSTDDKAISVDLARKLHQKTKDSANVVFREFEEGDHYITDEKIMALWDFIKNS